MSSTMATSEQPAPGEGGGADLCRVTAGEAVAAPLAAGQPALHPYVPVGPDPAVAFFGRIGRRIPRWAAPVALAGGCALASGYVLWGNPTDSGANELPSCLVKLTTGWDCPGCGGTRAAWYLLHGDVAAAAQHHMLFVFAVPFLVYAYLTWAASAMFGRRLPPLRVSFRTIGIALAAWGVFTVLRNLPFEPFSWFYV